MLNDRLPSRKVIGLIAVISMMALAGCFTPPGPPDQNETTPTPDPSPYSESGTDIKFNNVQESHLEQLNKSEGFAVTYNVTIQDPRISGEPQVYQKQYLSNTREGETRFRSNFSGTQREVYQDTVLYYERTGGEETQAQTNIMAIEDVENNTVTLEAAAGQSPLVKTGMNSSQYSLGNVTYSGDEEISTYSASQAVSNYDVEDLIPSKMDYQFGSPELTGGSERISSEVIMTREGMMKQYTFTYTATMFVDGSEEQYEMKITYTVERYGPTVTVDEPGWVQNTSSGNTSG